MKLRWRVPAPPGEAQESLFIEPRRGSASDPAELRTRGARLLLAFLWIQAAAFLVYLVVAVLAVPSAYLRFTAQTAFGWTVILLLAWAARRGWVVLASIGYLACGWFLLAASSWTGGGLNSSGTPGYLVLVVAAGLLLGTRATVITAAAIVLTGLGLALAGTFGVLPPPAFQNSPMSRWGDFAIYCGLIVAFQLMAARNLRVSESRYRSLVGRARDVIFTVSRDGRITTLNPAFEAVTGLPAGDWVGRPFVELIAGERAEAIWTELRRTQTALEVPVRSAAGERVLEVVLAMSPDASADLLGIGRDVSERKEAEARRAQLEVQLRQSQKREAIGTLASGIAHDFNNVLTAIMGQAQLLRDEGDRATQARATEILQAGGRARDVVRQLLTFARSTGQEHRPVRLPQVIGEALQLMRASLPASVQLEAAIDSGTAMVLADQGQMHQVVINLVANAAAALQGRAGTVGVYLGNLPGSLPEGGASPGTVRLRVTDDGIGMTPEVMERIFEPFFTTRPLGEGTGLGLAVVQGIVQDHGGQIFVRSVPGKGTTFDVELPAAGMERPEPAPAPGVAPRGAGERLLLVDDEPLIARVVSEQLRRLGYEVTAVNDPEEALELIAEDPEDFDLLLTDLQMPRMNGVELAARVGRVRPQLPVVLSTGNRWSISAATAKAAGIREIVDKPFQIEELAHALRAVLQGSATPRGGRAGTGA